MLSAVGDRRYTVRCVLFGGARPPLQARVVKFESEYVAKIRPVFLAFYQLGANGVRPHIIPFL